ncbi:head-tail adaptor protein [Alteriqipengyuania lutimaris]|uniref:Head-tail adaptor protein n=1 Tax=Alteriqipengyuania lutimaris TaxID=1538146 RepID=A0A395LKU0_9SPHN|nr:head-tail adaptor protein [Alteriqipengyuania lutimaris]MBB3034051.1 head-tail adaptor [Alteriqipengyuania lutimaris]RDS77007.1 head-tail adaptor protein [Alteriqipengyuania lutimaris]
MVRIGRRDKLVTLERATMAQNDYGEEVPTWSAIGQEWAAVFYGRGDERRQAAMEQGSQPATFGMLANPITLGLKVTDRIQHAGTVWDIEGMAPDTPRRGEIEITAVRGG